MNPRTLALALMVLAIGACKDLNRPDLNNPTVPEDGAIVNPTRSEISQLAIGVLIGNRVDLAAHIRDLEIIGRDAYNLDNADPRWVTELLGQSDFDPGGFGGAHWLARYRNVRNANILLASLATASTDIFTADEISAAEGFAKTFKALDLLYVLETRDALGAPVEVNADVDDLAPILCRDAALTGIAALLDEARTDLNVNSDLPFELPAGFTGFTNAEGFRQFNRAIRAKTAIYLRDWAGALTALNQSFLSTGAPLTRGVYHDFSIAPGDLANPLFTGNETFRAHPSVVGAAEAGDRRVAAKVATGELLSASEEVESDKVFTVYAGPAAPIPIIRNEELILLRAQANIGLNNLIAALADINLIRQSSGGLAPVGPFASQDAAITELLRQKRYSLLFESGSRWVDARLYNRLGQIPVESATYEVHRQYPIPLDEVNARGGNATCTNS
ncbi:MAG: RagB/SusD family nutrient uptake outer membrane protein [Steroidobacteraceae bacterium]